MVDVQRLTEERHAREKAELRAQMVRPVFDLQMGAGVKKELARLSPTETLVIKQLLLGGAQNYTQLEEFLKKHGLKWQRSDLLLIAANECMLVHQDQRDLLYRIKDDFKPILKVLLFPS